jgi:hypothetical protein
MQVVCMLRFEARLNFLIILCVSDVFQNEGFVQMVMAKHGDMDLFEFIDRNFLLHNHNFYIFDGEVL